MTRLASRRFLASLASLALTACGPSSPSGSDAGPLVDDAGPLAPDDAAVIAETDAGPLLGESLPLEARFPEGGAFDPVEGAFYVGSLADGSVHRIDRTTGRESVVFTETAPGTWWTLGMHVDATRRRLFVCAMDDQRETTTEDPPYLGYVWEIDLTTGERAASYDLSDAHPRATCTDVTATSDGALYVADREHPNVYRIVDGVVELFVTAPLLGSSAIGLNAITPTPDGSALLAIVYLPSLLARIDLSTREVSQVAITGGFRDALPALSGADGMAFDADGRLRVAFTSQLTTLEGVTAAWQSARASSVDVPSGMTDVVIARDAIYLLNGQAVRFALGDAPDPFALARLLAP
jgi:sugar lactone lactonase YvrE